MEAVAVVNTHWSVIKLSVSSVKYKYDLRLKHKTQVVIKNHHRKTLHSDSLDARTLIWDANCSPPLTTYGSVRAPAAGNIPSG